MTPRTNDGHPEEGTLRKFLNLELPWEEASWVDRHVDGCPECQQVLERLVGSLPGPLGTALEKACQPSDPDEAPPPLGDGYEVAGPIDAGGMGVVWRVLDRQFQRHLAVKVMKAKAASDPNTVRRFLAESQITSQLAHPFIVPVHTMGRLPDGRHYYTMKLVEGKTLEASLRERPDPASRRMEFVQIFGQVCQAVAYAHAKGVLHRDLKPANVMVGAHGEVQVMDWGLVKVLAGTDGLEDAARDANETTEEVGHDSGGQTAPNSVLGTYAYMSPEAASGEIDEVNQRSDVFGLGAILCVILTGVPPYTGRSLRSQAREARLDGALSRLRECDADAELVQLAERCLAPRKSDRPAHAGEVAAAVAAYQAAVQERLQQERLERERQQVKATEERRRRRGLSIASGVVVTVLVAGIVGTTIGLVQARNARQQAERAEAATLADYRASTDDAIEQLIGSKPTLGPQERTYLEKTLKRWQTFADRQGTDERSRAIRAEGTFRVAKLWHDLGKWDEARKEYEKARDLYLQLVDDFPTAANHRQGLAWTHNNLANLLAGLGKRDEAIAEYQNARDVHCKLVDDFPALPGYKHDLADTHSNLALLLAKFGNPDEAFQEFGKALVLLRNLVAEFGTEADYRQKLADTHNKLGNLLSDHIGKLHEAFQEYEKARDLRLELVRSFPDKPKYQNELAGTYGNMGVVLADLGKPNEAILEYQKARDLYRKLVGAFPGIPVHRQELAMTHSNLGNVLVDLGKSDEAIEEYKKALDHERKLVDTFPYVPAYQDGLAISHNNLGYQFARLRRWDEARKEYEKARDQSCKVVDGSPGVLSYQVTLGMIYGNLGALVLEEGRPADSLEWYDKAIETLTPIYRKEPRYAKAKLFLSNSHRDRAQAYGRLKKHAEAAKDWDEAIHLSSTQERLSLRASRADYHLRAGMVAEAVAEVTELTAPNTNATWTADQWYNFGCIYAIASTKSAPKKQEYEDRAMELLRKAVAAGLKDAAHMAKDTDLEPLRKREEFQQLLKAVEAKKRP